MNDLAKTILCALLLTCVLPALSAQLGLQLRPGFNDDLCPGYDEENTVIFDVTNVPPLSPVQNSRIEYYWEITHEFADWTYQTNSDARSFHLTLPGQYAVRCKVLYINLATTQPYASFWSAPLIIDTNPDCD